MIPEAKLRPGVEPQDLGPFPRLTWPLDALAPGTRTAGRRALAVALVAWLPLALLAAARGDAWGPHDGGAFLRDVSAHARYLVALPALLIAQSACFPRFGAIARHFGAAGFVPADERARYDAMLAVARRRFVSRPAGLVLVAVAYAASGPSAFASVPGMHSSWVAPLVDGVPTISPAGLWRALVSQPLLLTLAFTWLWRMLLWAAFLRRVSRLELSLVAAHPDGAGGLSFVATSLQPLAVTAFGFGAWAAGLVATELSANGWSLRHLQATAAVLVAFVLVLCAGPLLTLVPPLRRARLHALLEYDQLASVVGRRFEAQWLRPAPGVPTDPAEPLTFSDTVDLYGVVANVHAMRLTPITLPPLVILAVAALLPLVPVLLTVLPLAQALAFVQKLVL